MNRVALKQKLDKEFIDSLKNDPNAFLSFTKSENDSSVIYALEKFGKLDNSSCRSPLLRLLEHQNENIRLLAVKNLAKMSDVDLLEDFLRIAQNDVSTAVKRESVSAIGRLRNPLAIPHLIDFLANSDPKITLQAIRGLLVFSDYPNVKEELMKLENHPNELVQEVIKKEFYSDKFASNSNEPHDEFPSFLRNAVIQGDVEKSIAYIPDESVHLTFTSPPYYNARDYSIYGSYKEYLEFLKRVFSEVHRITKEGRFFVLNTSPVLIPRVSRSHSSKRYPIPFDIHPILIDIGWEFIDDIVWLKPEVTVKNRNAGFLQHRKPLAYKPNPVTEMVMVYRKKTSKLIDWNIRQYSSKKVNDSKVMGDYETRNVWEIDPTFDQIHSAVFPLDLCRNVIKFYSFVDDLIFDPFAGSGSLGEAALNLERNFLLTEQEESYVTRIKDRLKKHDGLFGSCDSNFFNLQEFISISRSQQ